MGIYPLVKYPWKISFEKYPWSLWRNTLGKIPLENYHWTSTIKKLKEKSTIRKLPLDKYY